MRFTPKEIATEITKHDHDFEMTYNPDFRQKIADSWPTSIDDSGARNSWKWQCSYDLKELVEMFFVKLKRTIVFD